MIGIIWLLTLIFKIIILPFLPITPDEAYYFTWGRHLQLSYFDHPPFVSWIMYIGQFFWKSSFGARFPGIIFEHLGMIPWILAFKNLGFKPKTIVFWIILIVFGPLTGLGGFIITPDVPLIFFWGLAFFIFTKLAKKESVRDWILLGTFFGLGMLSKYTMILFLPCILLYFILNKKMNQLTKPLPWMGLAVGALLFMPVIVWNYQNSWDSFRFQFNHGLSSSTHNSQGIDLNAKLALEYISAQIGLLNPILFVLALLGARKYFKSQKLLIIFGFFPLVFFLMTSLRSRVEANWPICAYPAITALGLYYAQENRKKAGAALKQAVAISVIFFFAVLIQVFHPWMPLKADNDRTLILRQWSMDIEALEKYHPLYSRSYQTAAYFSYFRNPDKEVFKPKGLDRKDFYDYLNIGAPKTGSYIVLDSRDVSAHLLEGRYTFDVVETLPSGMVLYLMRTR